jgi:hypothetical protein
MLQKHLKWFQKVNSTISNNQQSSLNNEYNNNENNEYFIFNQMYLNIIMIGFIILILCMIGLRIRKTRILRVIKQNQLPINNKEVKEFEKYHIIDHIIINVLPNAFHTISPLNYFESYGLFKRKVKKNDKESFKNILSGDEGFEYLKKIV